MDGIGTRRLFPAAAKAAATAGSSGNKDRPDSKSQTMNRKRESALSTAATMRVLNILRHWVSKHGRVSCLSWIIILYIIKASAIK